MIRTTDREIKAAVDRRVRFEMDGRHYTGAICDYWGAGYYWVRVDGEPRQWSVDADDLCYAD